MLGVCVFLALETIAVLIICCTLFAKILLALRRCRTTSMAKGISLTLTFLILIFALVVVDFSFDSSINGSRGNLSKRCFCVLVSLTIIHFQLRNPNNFFRFEMLICSQNIRAIFFLKKIFRRFEKLPLCSENFSQFFKRAWHIDCVLFSYYA